MFQLLIITTLLQTFVSSQSSICFQYGYACYEKEGGTQYRDCTRLFPRILNCPENTQCFNVGVYQNTIPCVPIQSSEDVTSSSEPVESSSIPIESSSDPMSSTEPIESSSQPSESSSEPTESSSEPVQSSSQPVQSSSQPVESSSEPTESSSQPEQSSNIPIESSEEVKSSSEPMESSEPIESSSQQESSNIPDESTEESESNVQCSKDGYFCVIDGIHDYQFLECNNGNGVFRDCSPGTKCAGEQEESYEYNPCIAYDESETSSEEIKSSSEPIESSSEPVQSSSQPVESSEEVKSSSEPMESSSQPEQSSSESIESSSQPEQSSSEPIESSSEPEQSSEEVKSSSEPMESSSEPVESSSEESESKVQCEKDGYFCVIDGIHDYQFLECNNGKGSFRDCSPGTKCAGEQEESYEYNPCIAYNENEMSSEEIKSSSEPIESSSEPEQSSEEVKSSSEPIQSSSQSESSSIPIESSSQPVQSSSEPMESSSEPVQSSSQPVESSSQPEQSSNIPVESSEESESKVQCEKDGYFCVIDGIHDYQFLICNNGKGSYVNCSPGTKCAGEQEESYAYNPCVMYDENETSSEDDSTVIPIDEDSSETNQSESDNCPPYECKGNGYYCNVDGVHNGQFVLCSDTYSGYMPCALGTWCVGEQDESYEYNPCVFIDETTWFGTNYTRRC